MPWQNVAELKASPLFNKMKMMHAWSAAQLDRFLHVFNVVYEKAKSHQASDEEAEHTAIPIALSSAKRLAGPDLVANLEAAPHFFVPMFRHQLGRDSSGAIEGRSYEFRAMQRLWQPLREAVAGITFNAEHDTDDPLGVIHDLLTVQEARRLGVSVPDDAPYVVVASYAKGISPEMRGETRISSEWLEMAASDGKTEAIPISFAVTSAPLNGEVLGITRVAANEQTDVQHKMEIKEGKVVYSILLNGQERWKKPFDHVPVGEELEKVLQQANAAIVDMTKPYVVMKDFSEPRTNLMPDQTTAPPLEEKLAAMAGLVEAEKKRADAAEQKFAALDSQVKQYQKLVDELKAAALDKEAEDAAQRLIVEGKIASDKHTHFAGLYKKLGKDEFQTLAAALPVHLVGEHAASVVHPKKPSIDAERQKILERVF